MPLGTPLWDHRRDIMLLISAVENGQLAPGVLDEVTANVQPDDKNSVVMEKIEQGIVL